MIQLDMQVTDVPYNECVFYFVTLAWSISDELVWTTFSADRKEITQQRLPPGRDV